MLFLNYYHLPLLFSLFGPVSSQSVNPLQDSVTDYAPNTNVACPDITNTQFVRQWTSETQSLNPGELEYIQTRNKSVIRDAWSSWLGDGSQLGYNISSFNDTGFPTIGIAVPGGGLRAALYGAGCLSALDARNESALAAGTGGLLQVASYITGLSGK